MRCYIFILLVILLQIETAEAATPFVSLTMRPGMSVAINHEREMRLALTSNGLCTAIGVRANKVEWYVRAAWESTRESVLEYSVSHGGPNFGWFMARESDRMRYMKYQSGVRWLFVGKPENRIRSFVGAGLSVGNVKWIRELYIVSQIEDTDTYFDRDGDGGYESLLGYYFDAGTTCKIYKGLSAEFAVSCGINYIIVEEEDNYGSDVVRSPEWYMFVEPLSSFGLRWELK